MPVWTIFTTRLIRLGLFICFNDLVTQRELWKRYKKKGLVLLENEKTPTCFSGLVPQFQSDFSSSFSGWFDVPDLADVRREERSRLICTDSCLRTVCGTWGYKAWSKSHQNNQELMRCFSTYLHSQALGNKAQHYWVVLLFSIYYSKQSWRDINTIILRRRIQEPFICAWKIWHLMTWNVLAWSRTYFITQHHPLKHCRLVGRADARELTGTCRTLGLLCYFQLLSKSLQFWFTICGFKKS